jgi:putative tryptophan/tyrosine transport system substrate-binding protein
VKTRWQLLAVVAAGLFAVPLGSLAQQPGKVWRVGILASFRRPEPPDSSNYDEFTRRMRELGYVEGKNLLIEWRFADADYERLPELAAELVRLKVDVIVTDATPATIAAQKATRTLPIVFASVGDPVSLGIVDTLARPGGNTTGLSVLSNDTAVKQMEMLVGMIPRLSRVAVLWNPASPASLQLLKSVQAAGALRKILILSFEAKTPKQIEDAFSAMGSERPGALVVGQDAFLFQQRRQIAELTAKSRLPSMGGHRGFAEAGGLMSYGPNRAYNYRRAATYVDKIFKGANPGNLPVEQPTQFELIINRKTARALGLAIPAELLMLANRVIE